MTLYRVARWVTLGIAAVGAWLALSAPAEAIPVFARQTGHNCQACHISYPELTAYGREFKLNGYTFGEAQSIPLAAAVMAEADSVAKNTDATTGQPTCSESGGGGPATCGHAQMVQYSIFFGGKLSQNFGMFGQASAAEFPFAAGGSAPAGSFTPTADNTEFRYIYRVESADGLEPAAVIGLNVNNNPTMEDVWNAVPAWRFPWFPYMGAGYGPLAAPYIDNPTGGHNKIGMGAYAWIQRHFYAELELYHAATGPLGILNWGQGGTLQGMGDQPSDVLDGYNPYYRFAYSQDWDYSSLEIGVFGMNAKTLNCNPLGNSDPTIACASAPGAVNTYRDTAIDFQYQYNKGEPWVFTSSGSFIHETSNLDALSLSGGSMAGRHTVNEAQIRATAYYQRKYGVTLGYSSLNGTTDNTLYAQGSGGSANGNPSSAWWTLELNYLPLQNLRFSVLYQNFTKINGGTSNFDGAGNNASGQNRLTGAIWFVF